MSLRNRIGVVAALITIAGCASAQSVDPNRIVEAGLRVGRLMDEGRVEEVWDGSSVVNKQRVTRRAFVDHIVRARGGQVAATARTWVSVTRNIAPGSAGPNAGLYVSVQYETSLANGKVVHELVSFRWDEDQTWRLAGYAVR
jgi:hypothetical protein